MSHGSPTVHLISCTGVTWRCGWQERQSGGWPYTYKSKPHYKKLLESVGITCRSNHGTHVWPCLCVNMPPLSCLHSWLPFHCRSAYISSFIPHLVSVTRPSVWYHGDDILYSPDPPPFLLGVLLRVWERDSPYTGG